MLTPASSRSTTASRSSAFNAGGLPNCFPAAFARMIPDCVRSISKSRSNSATAAITCIVIFPAELVRSTPPSARQCTRTPELAIRSYSATCIAHKTALNRIISSVRLSRRSAARNTLSAIRIWISPSATSVAGCLPTW